MKFRTKHLIFLCPVLCLSLQAQTLQQQKKQTEEPSEEVRKAIEEFNRMKREKLEKANEVTVVLDPPAPPKAQIIEILEEPENELEAPDEPAEKPILVTGKPQKVDEKPEVEPEPEPESVAEAEPIEIEDPGLEVRVESLRKGSGQIDPKTVTLKAGFPAKPLSSAPAGWKMDKFEGAPPVSRDVELQPGTVISLQISPHVLIPDADGSNIFSVTEPGFDALEGYHQRQTVSGILAKSVVQLDEDAKQLGNAISELHLILASLPKPETEAETNPEEKIKQ